MRHLDAVFRPRSPGQFDGRRWEYRCRAWFCTAAGKEEIARGLARGRAWLDAAEAMRCSEVLKGMGRQVRGMA